MIPINNSDTAWLIVADYNQENGKYHEELRKDVIDPEINGWGYEYYISLGMLVGHSGNYVGSYDNVGGSGNAGQVGRVQGVSGRNAVGGLGSSMLVGGNHDSH